MVSKLELSGHSHAAAERIADTEMKARVAEMLANVDSGNKTRNHGLGDDEREQMVRY